MLPHTTRRRHSLMRRTRAFRAGRSAFAPRCMQTRQAVHVADLSAAQHTLEGSPEAVAAVELGGLRTKSLVPMLKEDRLIGFLSIYRQEVQPFTDKQIELVTNFAAQAVIAIENTRLLNELRQRTDDLSEALEQQTATSEVLQVISSSPGELEPVFQAMLENATRICEANFGTLFLYEGDVFRRCAAQRTAGLGCGHSNVIRSASSRGTVLCRVADTKQVVHIADIRRCAYLDGDPQPIAASTRRRADPPRSCRCSRKTN